MPSETDLAPFGALNGPKGLHGMETKQGANKRMRFINGPTFEMKCYTCFIQQS